MNVAGKNISRHLKSTIYQIIFSFSLVCFADGRVYFFYEGDKDEDRSSVENFTLESLVGCPY